MAIDTAVKRVSTMRLTRGVPFPDGDIATAGDRQVLLGQYLFIPEVSLNPSVSIITMVGGSPTLDSALSINASVATFAATATEPTITLAGISVSALVSVFPMLAVAATVVGGLQEAAGYVRRTFLMSKVKRRS